MLEAAIGAVAGAVVAVLAVFALRHVSPAQPALRRPDAQTTLVSVIEKQNAVIENVIGRMATICETMANMRFHAENPNAAQVRDQQRVAAMYAGNGAGSPGGGIEPDETTDEFDEVGA